MNDQSERPVKAMLLPMDAGPGMGSMGVAAPVGAVSRKDRKRAERTALYREGRSGIRLDTALPGSVALQRWADGTWETLATRRASRLGRTRLELPDDATSSSVFRLKFSPKNANLPSWTSETIDG